MSSNTEIKSLALPSSWKQMRGIKQWQIKPGTILLKWVADSQQLQETHVFILEELSKYLFTNLRNINIIRILKMKKRKE